MSITRPLPRLFAVLMLFVATLTASQVVATTVAHADGCYTWGRHAQSEGCPARTCGSCRSGSPAIPGTARTSRSTVSSARRRRRRCSDSSRPTGWAPDGVAGPATFTKIYALQDDDCTPIHFTYAELDDGCGGSGFDGGPLSEAATKANALQTMWQLEALRHALGDQPLNITSGFRSYPVQQPVGGASNSQHLYGRSADLVGVHSLCTLAKQARYHGFGGIFGPGYPGHNDHTHADIRTSNYWSAPNCGI